LRALVPIMRYDAQLVTESEGTLPDHPEAELVVLSKLSDPNSGRGRLGCRKACTAVRCLGGGITRC
jgi:hypothetical protein